jgi:xanthine dehydrogenase/oxidase
MAHELSQALQSHLFDYSSVLHFWLNGEEIRIIEPDPTVNLVSYLHEQGLVGTKIGCEQGGCGACTLMISRRTDGESGADHRAINSCLRPLVAVADAEITTVEGIGNVRDGIDPVQHRISIYNGTQCGFCTPGFVMNMHSYLQHNESPTEQQIEDIFGGNLCRCTGYRPILHGMRTFACDYKADADQTSPCSLDPFFTLKVLEKPKSIDVSKLTPPAELKGLHFKHAGVHYVRPVSLQDMQQLRALLLAEFEPEQIKLIAGNTATGIYPDPKCIRFVIDISHIQELTELIPESDGIKVGAAVPIQDLMDEVESLMKSLPAESTFGLHQFLDHAKHIAGIQVRNAGSVAGNIFITKSHAKSGVPFPSDLFTVLSALGTTVTIWSTKYPGNEQTFPVQDMPIAEDLPPDALLTSFHIPFTREKEYVQTYRIARRPQMAHPIVNAGFRCVLDDERKVKEISVIYGGISTCNGRLPEIEKWLVGKIWEEATLKDALKQLRNEINEIIVPMDEEGFTIEYRSQLAEGFFYKFFLYVQSQIDPSMLGELHSSAAEQPVRPLSSGMQTFDVDEFMLPLTSPIARRTAVSQATGEVRYTHDLSLPPGGYYAEMVLSKRAHARFSFVGGVKGAEAALKKEFPSFNCLVTVADIPPGGSNMIGLGGDDAIFADKEVHSFGAAIGLVLTSDRRTSKLAAAYLAENLIEYENLPAIVSFDEAIEKKHVMPMVYGKEPDPTKHVIEIVRHGSDQSWVDNPTKAMNGGTLVSGTMRTHAQEHFYMETMCALAIPGSYDEMTVHSSTQNPNGDQAQIGRALGIHSNQVTVRVEQLGGGFGGKQNRAVFPGAMVAVAARKMRRPVIVKLSREDDMVFSGKRHPHISDYHASYDDDGIISGMHLELRADGGSSIDCSLAIIKGGVMMSDGCYRTPTFRTAGTVYKTNKLLVRCSLICWLRMPLSILPSI